MTYFVCDTTDLEGHGRAVVGGDRDRTDLFQAALNDYEKQGMTLHSILPAYNRAYTPDGQYLPVFIFHKHETGDVLSLDDIRSQLDS